MRRILTVEHAGKSFESEGRRIPVLKDVSFSVSEGEMLGIVGLSGCGKSTLLSVVAGLIEPDTGTVSLSVGEGIPLSPTSPELYRYVQLVVQEPSEMFSPRMTIGEFLCEPLRSLGLRQEDRHLEELFASVGLDADLLSARPHMLSGGQLQRVVLARAFLSAPKLILYDEPTSALDVITQAQILELIRELRKKRPSAGIFVSHDLAAVQSVVDRILVMSEGCIVEELAPSELTRAKHPATRRLLDAQLTG
ncbi:hypothetical protein TAMA11512_01220 [Selenomonas sp. TAMA-11512]|uniref:ABC transporter ATP-binding protein n=1 Tax=Selenomonas sp. TAMA-11512 TaxID=3095337 RepID=UPI0030921795|nr:hypothetical protein TAMA11512_01220 [Selenomonas sp. TAMA-11512]